jgi:glyceraldehyde-3-phosphate dehydrogenase (ferredoxin)
LLEAIINKRGIVDLSNGTRDFAKKLAEEKGSDVLDKFVYTAYSTKGWMVPNQYWTPGALSPMSIMGKYYMYYGSDFMIPEKVGSKGSQRLAGELIMDNIGTCRFHRGWAEEMIPEIIDSLFDLKDEYLENIETTSRDIGNRNASVYWESERNKDFVEKFLQRKYEVEQVDDPELIKWIDKYKEDKKSASQKFWYEMLRGAQEAL